MKGSPPIERNQVARPEQLSKGAEKARTGEIQGYADPDGLETVEAWSCAPGCSVKALDSQEAEGSRFFYCAKSSRSERNAGLEGFEEREGGSLKAGGNHVDSRVGQVRSDGAIQGSTAPNHQNVHPTVKPIDLMRWLVRLVCPPDGTVLDCFAGSGTTGIACVLEDFDFIGIERDESYVEIARARIDYWARQPKQLGLEIP